MNLGKGIKSVRVNLGLTQDEAANRANIAQGYYSLLENNHNKPSLETLEKICSALDVPMITVFWLGSERRDFKSKNQFEKFKTALDELIHQELQNVHTKQSH